VAAGLEGSSAGDLGRWIGVLECSGGCWFWACVVRREADTAAGGAWRASMQPARLLKRAPYARLLDRPSLVASTLYTMMGHCRRQVRCWISVLFRAQAVGFL
jgi:hypothetical protein